MEKRKLDSLIILRAIAVMAVCFCHFGLALKHAGNFYNQLFINFYEYGKYGVQIFFVVSGFVIPLSLYMGRYTINQYSRFLLKRAIRLHPPYLVALAVTLLVNFLSYKARGVEYPETVSSIVKSLFYFHFPTDNPVFWTLAIEVQYYLFIGVAYHLIIHNHKLFVFVLAPSLLLIGQYQFQEYTSLLTYILYFFIGIAGFMIYMKQGSTIINLSFLIVLLLLTYSFYGAIEFSVATVTIGFILWYRYSIPQHVKFFGEISYALYLIHFPIGIKFINLAKRYVDPSNNWMLLILTVIVASLLSWMFYMLFEEPFAKLSNRIKYNISAPKYSVLEPEV